jgi:hypothetical protein
MGQPARVSHACGAHCVPQKAGYRGAPNGRSLRRFPGWRRPCSVWPVSLLIFLVAVTVRFYLFEKLAEIRKWFEFEIIKIQNLYKFEIMCKFQKIVQFKICSKSEMFKIKIVQIRKCSNPKLFKFENVQIQNCSNSKMFKFKFVQFWNFSNLKLFKIWNLFDFLK